MDETTIMMKRSLTHSMNHYAAVWSSRGTDDWQILVGLRKQKVRLR